MPRVGHGVAEGMQPSFAIVLVAGERTEDDTGGAEHDRDRPWARDSDSQRGCGLIAGTGDLGRLVNRWEPLERDFEGRADLLRPSAPAYVEEKRARGIRNVDGEFPGQAEPNVVLR